MRVSERVHETRWKILALACLVLLGENFCYDIPAMVHDNLRSQSGLSRDEFPWFFNAMYSAYSMPNLFVPLLSGWTMDRINVSTAIVFLSIMSFSGQLITTYGM